MLLAEIKSTIAEANYECIYKEDGSDQLKAKTGLTAHQSKMCAYGYSYCECKQVATNQPSDEGAKTVCAIGPDTNNNLIIEQEVMF